jgi:hypothetical protein
MHFAILHHVYIIWNLFRSQLIPISIYKIMKRTHSTSETFMEKVQVQKVKVLLAVLDEIIVRNALTIVSPANSCEIRQMCIAAESMAAKHFIPVAGKATTVWVIAITVLHALRLATVVPIPSDVPRGCIIIRKTLST